MTGGGREVPEAERRVPEAERRVPEAERRVPEAERRVPEAERRVPDAERRVPDAERRVPEAVRERRVGSVRYWRQSGISLGQLRTLVRAGDLVLVRRGAYATRDAVAATKDDPARAHAVQVSAVRAVVGLDAVASHHSAAIIHGLELLKRPRNGLVTLTRSPTRRSRSRLEAGVVFHTADLPPEHVTRAKGTASTTVARTVIDLARVLPFLEAVVVADSALRAGTTKADLVRVIDTCARWPGISLARRAVDFSDGRAESVLESAARAIFHSFGLEAPQLQVTVRGTGFVYRVDFLWQGHKTVVEADGLSKYSSKEDIYAQFRRDRLLRDAGYKVVHVTWRELFETPEVVIKRVRAAFAAPSPY